MGAAVGHFLGVFANPALTWERLEWLRGTTSLPIVLKGILHPDDAREARERGVDGIVVSNHGGRQIDGAIASLDALPPIVDAVGDEMAVLLDSGIRSGADIFKALALGADAVLVGRPYLWGLALGGQSGVETVLRGLLAELDLTMALSGFTRTAEIDTGRAAARLGREAEAWGGRTNRDCAARALANLDGVADQPGQPDPPASQAGRRRRQLTGEGVFDPLARVAHLEDRARLPRARSGWSPGIPVQYGVGGDLVDRQDQLIGPRPARGDRQRCATRRSRDRSGRSVSRARSHRARRADGSIGSRAAAELERGSS